MCMEESLPTCSNIFYEHLYEFERLKKPGHEQVNQVNK